MKKTVAILLVLVLTLGLAACGEDIKPLEKDKKLGAVVADFDEMLFDAGAFDYFEAKGDRGQLYLYMSKESLDESITAMIDAGMSADAEVWVVYKEAFLEMYDAFGEMLDAAGFEDTKVVFTQVKGGNRDEVFLQIVDGELVYDVLEN